MTQLYTVVNENSGYVIASGLTEVEAMQVILTHDGHSYEIRPVSDGSSWAPSWHLWTSQFSNNSTCGGRPLVKSVIYSLESNEFAATQDIARQVIAAGWASKPEAFEDEEFKTDRVRLHYENDGKEVRIDAEGHVEFREPDGEWLEGRWVSEYRLVDGDVVLV
ncbi:MAG TPA: hypothetical protein VM659_28860 [Dongiaceae bacterium]|nr:hypothetical protein [Dongiaceae bacterium]